MKKAITLAILFSLLASFAFSEVFVYDETDTVSLNISAADPDSDPLSATYSGPLNRLGEWKTSYGDSGVYRFNVSVSDGELSDSKEITLIINRKEAAPTITSLSPSLSSVSIPEGRSLSFSLKAIDPNNDALHYFWTLDSLNVSNQRSFTYSPSYLEGGEHILIAYADDGRLHTINEWKITVIDVDLDSILFRGLADITASETEIVRLAVPDFNYYGLSYEFESNAPFSNGFWQTDYNSSGSYKASLRFFGKGYDKEKSIKIKIDNKDRPPVLSPLFAQSISEGETLSLALSATDPDGDKIRYLLDTAPDGASLDGNVFSWSPDYSFVQTDGESFTFPRNFHALSSAATLRVSAMSGNLSDSAEIPLIVFNTNRAPTAENPKVIYAREGELFSFSPTATDPDSDPLSYSYEGEILPGTTIGYDLSGTHQLKIRASDGFLSDSITALLVISDTNRAPFFPSQKKIIGKENHTLSIPLNFKDPDNDPLQFSLINAPSGMILDGDSLHWTPSFSVANSTSNKEISFEVLASDGKNSTSFAMELLIENTNQPVELSGESIQKITAKRGVPISLFMNATDPDSDSLSYTWKFGMFEKYEGDSPFHKRTFSTKGVKKIHAVASDGSSSIKKEFLITVI